jgi:hypothetical protein
LIKVTGRGKVFIDGRISRYKNALKTIVSSSLPFLFYVLKFSLYAQFQSPDKCEISHGRIENGFPADSTDLQSKIAHKVKIRAVSAAYNENFSDEAGRAEEFYRFDRAFDFYGRNSLVSFPVVTRLNP